MHIIKERYARLEGIHKIALLADVACREGWERTFPPLLKMVWEKHKPGLFIVAGDLSLNGREVEYRKVFQYLKRVPSALAAVAGDHDRPLKMFLKCFGSLRKVIDVERWRFIGVDTSDRMFLKREAEWIQRYCRPDSIIFTHVPPEAPGWTFHSLWPRSSNRFLDVVKRNRKKIKAMYFGHIHGYSKRRFLEIPMIVTGAVAESRIVRNNGYRGPGFFEMVIFDTPTGKTDLCTMSSDNHTEGGFDEGST